MRAKFGHDRSGSLAAYTWQTHTQTEFVLYRYRYYTSWIPGFARDPLSRSLSPSLSRPSLPSLLFVPAFYPLSLGLPGFAQDNCIPEILFKPWSLVTLKCSPLTPPPAGWGGVGVTRFGYFFGRIWFFLSIFSAVREISRTFKMLTPQPPPGRWTPRSGVGKNLFYWFSGHSWVSLTLVDWRQRKRRHYVAGFIVTSFATQRLAEVPIQRLAQWPHASRPFMEPIFGRNHSQVYPHMRAKFGHDRSSSLDAYTWQTHRQTDRICII